MSRIPFEELMTRREELNTELSVYVSETAHIGQVLQHPLVYAVPYHEMMNALYNEQLKQKKEAITEAMKEKNYDLCITLYERPHRVHAFARIAGLLPDTEYWKILHWIWTDSENIWQNKKQWKALLQSKRPGKEEFMTAKEKELLNALPDKFVIHRGHVGINKIGYSNTLSYKHACSFSLRSARQKEVHLVRSAMVNKEDIIGVITSRTEAEVICTKRLGVEKEPVFEYCRRHRTIKINQIIEQAKSVFKLGRNYSDHGFFHWEKVEYNALVLAQGMEGVDLEVVQAFAHLHDCKREDEMEDRDHGRRAAVYVRELYDSKQLDLSLDQMNKLEFALMDHSAGETVSDPTVATCWDADRLDLIRVGIIPDRKYLSTELAKELLFKI